MADRELDKVARYMIHVANTHEDFTDVSHKVCWSDDFAPRIDSMWPERIGNMSYGHYHDDEGSTQYFSPAECCMRACCRTDFVLIPDPLVCVSWVHRVYWLSTCYYYWENLKRLPVGSAECCCVCCTSVMMIPRAKLPLLDVCNAGRVCVIWRPYQLPDSFVRHKKLEYWIGDMFISEIQKT